MDGPTDQRTIGRTRPITEMRVLERQIVRVETDGMMYGCTGRLNMHTNKKVLINCLHRARPRIHIQSWFWMIACEPKSFHFETDADPEEERIIMKSPNLCNQSCFYTEHNPTNPVSLLALELLSGFDHTCSEWMNEWMNLIYDYKQELQCVKL